MSSRQHSSALQVHVDEAKKAPWQQTASSRGRRHLKSVTNGTSRDPRSLRRQSPRQLDASLPHLGLGGETGDTAASAQYLFRSVRSVRLDLGAGVGPKYLIVVISELQARSIVGWKPASFCDLSAFSISPRPWQSGLNLSCRACRMK